MLPVLPTNCTSRSHARASRDLGNLSHLFLATTVTFQSAPITSTQHFPGSGSPPATLQLPRGMQGTLEPSREMGKGLFLPFVGAPPPSHRVCGLFTVPIKCTLGPGRRCGAPSPHLAASVLSPSIKQLAARRRGGKSQQRVWFAVFVGTLQLQRLPSGSQGARGRGQQARFDLPFTSSAEGRDAHTQRKKKRKMRSWQTLLSSNLSSP